MNYLKKSNKKVIAVSCALTLSLATLGTLGISAAYATDSNSGGSTTLNLPNPLSPDILTAQAAVKAAYLKFQSDMVVTSAAEQASKADPTNPTLSDALALARAISTPDYLAWQSARAALNTILEHSATQQPATPPMGDHKPAMPPMNSSNSAPSTGEHHLPPMGEHPQPTMTDHHPTSGDHHQPPTSPPGTSQGREQLPAPATSTETLTAQAVLKTAYLKLKADATVTSAAEKASKADPTNAALSNALAAARTVVAADFAAYKAAQDALRALGGAAEGNTPPPGASHTPPPASDKSALKKALELLNSTYKTLRVDQLAVSVAESASKADPTNATLSGALIAARATFATDLTTYKSSLAAYQALGGSQTGVFTRPPNHKP